MKKVILSIVMVLMLTVLAGCEKKATKFVVDEIQAETIYVKRDKTIEAATVEEFSKKHYDLAELKDFIQQEIEKYNKESSTEAITINDLVLKDGNAVLVLKYNTVEDYAKFNNFDARIYPTTELKLASFNSPKVYVSAKDGSYVDSEVALKNEKYNVLIINQSTDVIIDGTIVYYDNAVLVSKNKVQTPTDGISFIVYKPK
jgi:hypothetical protein